MCSKNKCHPQAEDIGEHFEESTIGTFLQNAVDISGSVPYDQIERNYNVGFVESINSEVLNRENQFKKRMKRSKSTSALYRSSGQNSDSAESSSSSLDSLIKNELVGTKALQPLSVFKAKERFVSNCYYALFYFLLFIYCFIVEITFTEDLVPSLYWDPLN